MNTFRVWAPRAKTVDLLLEPQAEKIPLHPTERGYFEGSDERIRPGQHYTLSLDRKPGLPDPRSPLQPAGVHGPSCWVDFDGFHWTDQGFKQCPLTCAVMYELHIGTFTPEGTFEAAIAHLPELRALGVTHVEIMPVAHFSGTRGWGYDGVYWFAPHTAYGGPIGLQTFVNACHEHELAVILDVVYNHLGPSGNYLGEYGPYFTSKYKTPWGDALNFDVDGSDEVRRMVCDNAKFWLRNYHIDGLRLDAIHAILDQSATHILAQLAQEVDSLSTELGRPLIVIAESGLNDARVVNPAVVGGYDVHTQWSDDFHHALHALLTKEDAGYYQDYGRIEHLAEALRHGFVYRGQYSPFRNCSFGGATTTLRGRQLVVAAQNHDQIGNRAKGDRLTQSLSPEALKIAAAVTLLSPFVPLLFMGEEWASRAPFQYFTDHEEPELQRAVREGRQQEFAAFGWDPEEVPDPGDPVTFESSKLDWSVRTREPHASMLQWYTQLLHLRRESGGDDRLAHTHVAFDEKEGWLSFRRGRLTIACNFASQRRTWTFPSTRMLVASHPDVFQKANDFDAPALSVIILEDHS